MVRLSVDAAVVPIVDSCAALEQIVAMRIIHCLDIVDSPDTVSMRSILQKAALR